MQNNHVAYKRNYLFVFASKAFMRAKAVYRSLLCHQEFVISRKYTINFLVLNVDEIFQEQQKTQNTGTIILAKLL